MRLQGRRSKLPRGFTLTELAIVIGIIGLILGAIWTAAGMVNSANKTQKAMSDVSFILQNYRSLFPRGVDTGSGWADITCQGVTSGFFPASTMNSAACYPGLTSTYPIPPWGGYYQVWGYQSWQGIIIVINGLTIQACAALGVQLLSQPDVIWEEINSGTDGPFPPWGSATPWTTSQIISQCNAAGTANFIDVMYKN
jgi:prepilin-type N-terminal cleavage/methylation domain-containing protein